MSRASTYADAKAMSHTFQMWGLTHRWYLLRCPICHWNYDMALYENDNTVECPHCHKQFDRLSLCMMYPEIGGLSELNEQEAAKATRHMARQRLLAMADLYKD